MQKEEIEQKIKSLGSEQRWNHSFSLPYGLKTKDIDQKSHGKNLVKYQRLSSLFDLVDLNKKKVLDMGCNEGFFSHKLEEKGAIVTGIDIDKNRLEKAEFIKQLLKPEASIEFKNIDIYSKEFESLEEFDLCLCLGFIHRIPDPFRAISIIASKSDLIIFEWKALKFGPHDESFAYFSEKDINSEDYYGTEYWLLSYKALERVLERCGFSLFYRLDDPSQKRAILVAGKIKNKIFDEQDKIIIPSRLKAFLSHTKRYLITVLKIIMGKMNA